MKGNFFKTFFILLVVILLTIAIQNTFLKQEEKTDSVKAVADEVRNLNNRVQRLEYNNTISNNITKPDRRSEN